MVKYAKYIQLYIHTHIVSMLKLCTECHKIQGSTVRPRSLVQFHTVTYNTKFDKTSWINSRQTFGLLHIFPGINELVFSD